MRDGFLETVTLDGTRGLWPLEDVVHLLEDLGYCVEVQTPLDIVEPTEDRL